MFHSVLDVRPKYYVRYISLLSSFLLSKEFIMFVREDKVVIVLGRYYTSLYYALIEWNA